MSRGSHETEIKLAVADRSQGMRRLRAAGFSVSKRRVFEANTVFDTSELTLRNGAELLRLREADGVNTVTYKGPPKASRHKSREELEVEVSRVSGLRAILDRLGYRPVFRYEKYRTELTDGQGGGVATVDETPIGVYMELEGSPRWIDRTARRMGFRDEDYITVSYGWLYREWCALHGVDPKNMVFRGAARRPARPSK